MKSINERKFFSPCVSNHFPITGYKKEIAKGKVLKMTTTAFIPMNSTLKDIITDAEQHVLRSCYNLGLRGVKAEFSEIFCSWMSPISVLDFYISKR